MGYGLTAEPTLCYTGLVSKLLRLSFSCHEWAGALVVEDSGRRMEIVLPREGDGLLSDHSLFLALLDQIPSIGSATRVHLTIVEYGRSPQTSDWWRRAKNWSTQLRWQSLIRARWAVPVEIKYASWNSACVQAAVRESTSREVAVLLGPQHDEDYELWFAQDGHASRIWEMSSTHDPEQLLNQLCRVAGYEEPLRPYMFLSLASLGEARYTESLQQLIALWESDGRVQLSTNFLSDSFWIQTLGANFRRPSEPIGVRELDLACSAERLFEQLIQHMGFGIRHNLGVSQVVVVGTNYFLKLLSQYWLKQKIFQQVYFINEDPLLMAARGSLQSPHQEPSRAHEFHVTQV